MCGVCVAAQRACIACGDLPRAQRVFDDLVGAPLPRTHSPLRRADTHTSPKPQNRKHTQTRASAHSLTPLRALSLSLFLDAGVIVPDEVLFSVLIRAHGAGSAPKWGDISALLGRMKHTWGIAPGTVTYNALLETCAATNDYERGCQARGSARCVARAG